MDISFEGVDTLPKQFLKQVEKWGDRQVALRQKDYGIWQEFTWVDSLKQVRELTMGLVALGMQHGDKVAIVGDNDRQYLWAGISIMSAGGAVVGIFTDATPDEAKYVSTHSEAVFAFAKDQEQCDKFLSIREDIPDIKQVIYWDARGMWGYDDPWLMSYDDVQKLGREVLKQNPNSFSDLVAAGKGDDLCNLCYTSGTTGLPKGAMLTHLNFMYGVAFSAVIEPRDYRDNVVSFSPLAWIAENSLSVAPHCMYGLVMNFPESPETVQANIREIAPDVIFYPARLWENLTSAIQISVKDSTWINRTLYNIFLKVGYELADVLLEGKTPSPWLRFRYWLGDRLVFLPLRSQLGLHKVRTSLTAGAALGPDMVRYFKALGLSLRQVYASTETSAVGAQHYPEDVNYASVGRALPGIKVEVSEEGELIIGGKNVFHGYFKNAEATEEALFEKDGTRYFRTGDAGYINDEGQVIYLDRMKDMIKLSHGEKFSPQFIEGRLKFSPYIRDVMAYGNEEVDYVSAIIGIDFANVGRWAEKKGIPYTTFVDLSQKPQIADLILEDVRRVNATLPEAGKIKKFVMLHKEFDADEAEMTRTRKLRRRFLADRYNEMIDAIYSGRDSYNVRAEVKYQDGRVSIVETEVRIISAEERVPA